MARVTVSVLLTVGFAILFGCVTANPINRGPFWDAIAVHRDINEVRQLLDAGTDVNLNVGTNINTPLSIAVVANQLEIAKLLLDRGADVNGADNFGRTPLTTAVTLNRMDFIRLLTARGAKINGLDNLGMTPIMWSRDTDSARLLITLGADVSIRDKRGMTALDHAKESNHTEIYEVLLEASNHTIQQLPIVAGRQDESPRQTPVLKRPSTSSQQANSDSLSPDDKKHYKKMLTGGSPAQIYVMALKLESHNRPDLAANLYQRLIDRFPDSNYTAKAIDKMEAAQKAGQQRQVMQQQMAVQGQQRLEQIAALKQANEDRIAKCTARCDEALSSCNSQKNDRSIGSSLMGYINHDPSIIQRDMVNNLTGPSCEAANQSCKSSCR